MKKNLKLLVLYLFLCMHSLHSSGLQEQLNKQINSSTQNNVVLGLAIIAVVTGVTYYWLNPSHQSTDSGGDNSKLKDYNLKKIKYKTDSIIKEQLLKELDDREKILLAVKKELLEVKEELSKVENSEKTLSKTESLIRDLNFTIKISQNLIDRHTT